MLIIRVVGEIKGLWFICRPLQHIKTSESISTAIVASVCNIHASLTLAPHNQQLFYDDNIMGAVCVDVLSIPPPPFRC